MRTKNTAQSYGLSSPRLTAGLLLGILVAGGLLACWEVGRTDREMRAALLEQTRQVAQAVEIQYLQALSGTEADGRSPVWQRLKEQLGAIRSVTPQCRRVFLLGRRPDESIFYFVGNEAATSKLHASPGQVYDAAPEACQRVFATQNAAAEGPYADHGDNRVSALVPILDPRTAVYGLATPEAAQAMVRKAIDFYHKNGRQSFLTEINKPQGEFRKGDLYAFVYDRNMIGLAHPIKPELVGQNLLDKKDWSGGKYFHREIQQVARSKGHGWVDFEYENPVNRQHDHKTTYVEGVDDLIVCAGAYRGAGEVVAVMGLDVDARAWNWRLVRAALPPGLLTLALAAISLIGFALFARRSRTAGTSTPRMWRFEPALVAAAGLVLTLFAAWMAREREAHDRNEAFVQLAANRMEAAANTLRDLRDTGLEGLAHFHEQSPAVTPEAFGRFAAYLTKNPALQAWGWVPAVPVGERPRFEASARAAGLMGFEIWQNDAQGKRVPASERPVFYPVVQVAPLKGNEGTLGYDLGSEPLRRAALEAAASTGLPTATDPIVLVQETGTQKGMLLYRPVFGSDDPKPLRGFALAVLRMGALLGSAAPDNSAFMELSLLRQDATPQPLAVSWGAGGAPVAELSATRSVFAFGRVFWVTAHAGPEFLRLHPVRAGEWVMLTGILLTFALAMVLRMNLRRHEELERLVWERTTELRQSERFLQSALDALSAHIAILDEQGRIIAVNAPWNRFARQNEFSGSNYAVGANYLSLCESAVGDRADEAPSITQGIRAVMARQCEEFSLEYPCHSPQERRWFVVHVTRFDGEGPVRVVVAHENITARKQVEENLKQAQGELLHASRLAGMAEVATSVLHNVGNVLNSVNVSTNLVSDRLKDSKIANLTRAAALMGEHTADLGEFLANDPKGRMLPLYLSQLADYLIKEQASLLKELGCLRKNVEHIKEIVAMQQGYAKATGAVEVVKAAELVEDALRMNTDSLERQGVQVIRDYAPQQLPEIKVAKHKVLQILVNLLRNAKIACDQSDRADKRLTVRVTNGDGCLRISVIDNGVGIPAENLPRLFTHGFTTRKDGHGFGLHSSLLAAREVGGTLQAHSEGLGQGATFTLELPVAGIAR
jgi:CHASE1-domain containing sensor protein/signal transduction histidine kinase